MIYLVEDETNIRELLVYTLQSTGFEARGFASGKDFWAALDENAPRLVMLDIMLPGEDGLSILKRLKSSSATAAIPVMMLTAKGTEYDKVLGLDLGADDYLPKPFGMMELVARVKNLLRRSRQEGEKGEYSAGGLYASVPRHVVTVFGDEVKLTLKEFDLLIFLIKNAGMALTRDHILSAVWGYDFDGETRTVDVHIRTLRNKLGECGKLIETVRGLGYKIGAPDAGPTKRGKP
ncbi:MAG: response regulator transcription factor [Clostridiales Family XIII bacterium]|jgi:two-component system alkaline phosphatase synthesis response regulator PhoP|nr:response regulator transcription factor [Clostridiales Family XIII bacterium]